MLVDDLRRRWCGSLRMVGLLHHEKPLVSPHPVPQPLMLPTTSCVTYLSPLITYPRFIMYLPLLLICSCKAAEKNEADPEAPALADTKPQIVRVNSGNTPIHDLIHTPS